MAEDTLGHAMPKAEVNAPEHARLLNDRDASKCKGSSVANEAPSHAQLREGDSASTWMKLRTDSAEPN